MMIGWRRGKQSTFYPSGRGANRRWVYLIGMQDGRIKVGVTQNPSVRIRCHKIKWGGDVFAWCHLFRPIEPRISNPCERAAILALSTAGQRLGLSEEFYGIQKQDAIRIVRAEIDRVIASVGNVVPFRRAA